MAFKRVIIRRVGPLSWLLGARENFLNDLNDSKSAWAHAIGRAFVAFGSVEYITILCLEKIPKDRIVKSVGSFRLVQRIDLILELLEAYTGEPYEVLCAQLKLAKSMAPTRNLLAHNPLFVEISRNANGTNDVVQSIKSAKDFKKSISLLETQKFAIKTEKLETDLYAAVMNVFPLH